MSLTHKVSKQGCAPNQEGHKGSALISIDTSSFGKQCLHMYGGFSAVTPFPPEYYQVSMNQWGAQKYKVENMPAMGEEDCI